MTRSSCFVAIAVAGSLLTAYTNWNPATQPKHGLGTMLGASLDRVDRLYFQQAI